MRKQLRFFLSGLLIMILTLCGCSSSNVLTSGEVTEKESASEQFQNFTRQLFIDSVSTDALTLHYELKDPSAYHISLDTIDLGRIDPENTTETDDSLTYHGFDPENIKQIIDFVFVDRDTVKPLKFKVIDEKVNGEYYSDHYAVYADIELK